jgi:hypothetical protein
MDRRGCECHGDGVRREEADDVGGQQKTAHEPSAPLSDPSRLTARLSVRQLASRDGDRVLRRTHPVLPQPTRSQEASDTNPVERRIA